MSITISSFIPLQFLIVRTVGGHSNITVRLFVVFTGVLFCVVVCLLFVIKDLGKKSPAVFWSL